MKIKVKKLDSKAIIPRYASEGSSGLDLYSIEECRVNPGEIKLIPTGISIEIPDGYEGQIRPRSGIASKYGITIINTPGTIDSDYRGELKLAIINLSKTPYSIHIHDRLAQLVISPVVKVDIEEVNELSETQRGKNGFGSTGGF
ncbi:MAG: dUTP diphosphatase [Nanopusillaceae archaeon]